MSLFPEENILTKELESWRVFADGLKSEEDKKLFLGMLEKCQKYSIAINAKEKPFPSEQAYEIAQQSKSRPRSQQKQEPYRGNEPQLLEQGTHFRIFQILDPEKIMIKSKSGEKLVEFELYMPGITFPLDKKTMLDYAEREFVDRDAILLNVFQSLDEEEYKTKESLEYALTLLLNNTRKDFFGKKQTVDKLTIYTTKEELSNQIGEFDKRSRKEMMNVPK